MAIRFSITLWQTGHAGALVAIASEPRSQFWVWKLPNPNSTLDLGFIPVVPPKSNRVESWRYDRVMYLRRNEIERLFRIFKGFRRILSRFEKLDVVFMGFIHFALTIEGLPFC